MLSDTELIAIMLHTGIQGHSVLGLASQLIAQAGSIAGLANWQPEDFRRLKGIGRAKGQQLAALVEIGRRMIRQPATEAPMLNRPELIAALMALFTRGLEVEKFWVLCLNRTCPPKPLACRTGRRRKKPAEEAGRGHLGDRHLSLGPSTGGIPQRGPAWSNRHRLCPQPPIGRPRPVERRRAGHPAVARRVPHHGHRATRPCDPRRGRRRPVGAGILFL